MTATAATRRSRARRVGFVDSFLWSIRIVAVIVIAWGVIGSLALTSRGEGLSGAAWRDLFVTGLAQGSMYGLIALGYSMVYGVLGFINFAHGEVFMTGAMVGFFAADALAEHGVWDSNPIAAITFTMLVSAVTSTLVAVAVEKVAYRPLRGAPRLIPLITSIGMSFFIQYSVRGLFGSGFVNYPAIPEQLSGKAFFGFQKIQLIVIVIALVSMAALYTFVTRTKTGRAMRAIAEDKEIAALMGINVDRTIVTTFAVGGFMAGIAGTLWSLLFSKVFFFTGFLPGIKAFTAAVLGGIGNLAGAMLGGITLGIFEALGPQVVLGGLRWQVPLIHASITIPGVSQLRDVVAFTALVLVLIFRPTGLLGERLAVEERG